MYQQFTSAYINIAGVWSTKSFLQVFASANTLIESEHGLDAIDVGMWHVFLSTIAVTSLAEAERKSYLDLLAEYRWILRISSTGTSVTKHGVEVLDSNQLFLEQHSEIPVLPQDADSLISPENSAISEEWMDQQTFNFQDMNYIQEPHDLNVYSTDGFFNF